MNFSDVPRPSHDAIARRAYEIFLERGGIAGDPLHDWLRAEAELIAETAPPPTLPSEAEAPSPRKAQAARKRSSATSSTTAAASRPRVRKSVPSAQAEPSATPRQRSRTTRPGSKRA